MRIWRPFKTFRGQLVASLLLTVALFFLYAGKTIETDGYWQITNFFLIISTALIVFLLLYIIVNVSSSLKQLTAGIEQIKRGNLKYKINLSADNEFGSIARFLNSATKNLAQARDELMGEKQSVEEKVKVRTKELAAERNKLALTLMGMTDAVITLDLDRRIVYANAAAEKLTGFTLAGIRGFPFEEIFRLREGEIEIAPSIYAPRVSGFEGIVFDKKDLEMSVAGGKKVNVNIKVGQIEEGEKVNIGCIVMLHDVSEARRLKEMRFDFVTMAAHQLRTPISALRGYIAEFLKNPLDNLTGKQAKFLTRLHALSQQLYIIVENLLQVTHIEKGFNTIAKSEESWDITVSETVGEYMDIAADKGITITFDNQDVNLPLISIDKVKMSSVLGNLISNAINHTTSAGKITVTVKANDSEIITAVSDTGCGIPKEALAKLFTKYFHVGGRLEHPGRGTGLGLYISKIFIELHKGRIWVDSEEGRGSTFYFSLPLGNSL